MIVTIWVDFGKMRPANDYSLIPLVNRTNENIMLLLFIIESLAEFSKHRFSSRWFDPTWNRTRVYRFTTLCRCSRIIWHCFFFFCNMWIMRFRISICVIVATGKWGTSTRWNKWDLVWMLTLPEPAHQCQSIAGNLYNNASIHWYMLANARTQIALLQLVQEWRRWVNIIYW